MGKEIKKIVDILLTVCFLMSVTAAVVGADNKESEKKMIGIVKTESGYISGINESRLQVYL
jgi:hypothetical protein